MMQNTQAITNDAKKFNTFKTERKKIHSPAMQSGYINFLYPSVKDKVQAFAFSSCFDDDEDARESIYDEIAEACKFDPWRVMIYLQAIAADMTDLAVRAFRLMLENLKPKPKEKYDCKFAEANNPSDYDFKFTGEFDQKKFPKKKMKMKAYDLSYSRDKKGQSDMIKEINARVYASEKKSTEPTASAKAEKSRTSFMNGLAAQSMAGEGGCSHKTWGGDSGGHFAPCGPSYDYGFMMNL